MLGAPLCAHAQKGDLLLSGYVTAIHADGSFEINGAHVQLKRDATFSRKTGKEVVKLATLPPPWLGEAFQCYGDLDKGKNPLVVTHLTELVPRPFKITGEAIVEAVIPEGAAAPAGAIAPAGSVTVRADGYLLQLPAGPDLHFEDGLTAAGTNQWIAYKGILSPDGIVTVDEATLSRNLPPDGEIALRERQTFNPEEVDPANRQSGFSKAFTGTDPKRLPPHPDPALQARVEAIGKSLVPAWQSALPPDDPSRIDFRFPVVDNHKERSLTCLTSGIIIIPFPVVERLYPAGYFTATAPGPRLAADLPLAPGSKFDADSPLAAAAQFKADSKLAAVIAACMAEVLEKQKYRDRGRHRAYLATNLASAALAATPVGIFASPFGFGSGAAEQKLESREGQQSGRVSLWLMHDAGYDITAAPLAWWSLWAETRLPLALVDPTAQTMNLYAQLGTTWHTPPPTPAPAPAPAP